MIIIDALWCQIVIGVIVVVFAAVVTVQLKKKPVDQTVMPKSFQTTDPLQLWKWFGTTAKKKFHCIFVFLIFTTAKH